MRALVVICGIILVVIISGIAITNCIVDAELHGGFIKAWKFKRYWKRLHN